MSILQFSTLNCTIIKPPKDSSDIPFQRNKIKHINIDQVVPAEPAEPNRSHEASRTESCRREKRLIDIRKVVCRKIVALKLLFLNDIHYFVGTSSHFQVVACRHTRRRLRINVGYCSGGNDGIIVVT